jgi:hypothetical protein
MNCPECNAPISIGTRYCPACGITLPTPASEEASPVGAQKRTEQLPPTVATPAHPSPTQVARQRRSAERLIDDFIREGGVEDPAALTDEEGCRHVTFGTAPCRVRIVEDEGELYLHTIAFVIKLPSDKELIVPLMRELLELNLMLRGAVRVGIDGERVFAMATRPVIEMEREEFVNCIFSVMSVADEIDDILLAKYSGTAKQRRSPKSRSKKESS